MDDPDVAWAALTESGLMGIGFWRSRRTRMKDELLANTQRSVDRGMFSRRCFLRW